MKTITRLIDVWRAMGRAVHWTTHTHTRQTRPSMLGQRVTRPCKLKRPIATCSDNITNCTSCLSVCDSEWRNDAAGGLVSQWRHDFYAELRHALYASIWLKQFVTLKFLGVKCHSWLHYVARGVVIGISRLYIYSVVQAAACQTRQDRGPRVRFPWQSSSIPALLSASLIRWPGLRFISRDRTTPADYIII